jgi:hypothetical protein
MNCGGAPEVSSRASRGRTGVTELALLIAHERECADCRHEQVSAQVSLLADPPLTSCRARGHSLAKTIVAGRTGAARTIDGLTRGRVALSTSMTSALTSTALASARITATLRVGSAWLRHSARPLAQVPETVGVATARLANRLVQLHGLSVVRMRATARSTILLQRGLLAGLADRCRTVAATMILAARYTSERGVRVLARGRGFLTPETGFLLRVCAGIAGLGILAMALIFAWPRPWPDNHWPDKTSTGPAGIVSTTKPRAEPETVEAVAAPPSLGLPTAPSAKEAVRTTTRRPPTPTPQPESAAPAHRQTPPLAREAAAPDAPDPSAAIDWLLKGAGATSRQDGPTE